MTPAQYTGLLAAVQALGVNIGQTVVGGTATRVLYVGAGPVLAQSANMTFDTALGFIISQGGFTITLGLVGTCALRSTDGTRIATLSDGTRAVGASDGTNSADLCAGNSAIQASRGAVVVSLCKLGVAASLTDGTRTVTICDGTNNIKYTAATAADWAASTPPTDVWVALDRIAAALTTLLTPP